MRNAFMLAAAVAAIAISAPAQATPTVAYNTAPTNGFNYGSGNNYTPANAAVLSDGGDQLALRLHEYGVQAPASDGSGVYSFALGTNPINFDWSIDQSNTAYASTLLTLTNLGTGQTASYDPLCPIFIGFCLSDNYVNGAVAQNSEQLGFTFFGDLGFDPNVNDTYQINLSATDLQGVVRSLNVFAQVGSGAPSGVPEPATWAMMLLGFGCIGLQLRRKRHAKFLTQSA